MYTLHMPGDSRAEQPTRWLTAETAWILIASLALAVLLASAAGPIVALAGLGLLLLGWISLRWLRLQQRIRAVAREWQQTLDAVDSPILALDSDGHILRLNRAAMQLSGQPYRASLGRQVADLGSDEPWRSAAAQADRALRGIIYNPTIVEDKAGRSWEITTSQITDPAAKKPALVVIARDISERVELQRACDRQELMAATGAVVAGVAHDMRNFLFAIEGTVDLFDTRFGDREDQRPLLGKLREHSERMSALMQTLIDYGRPEELAREPWALQAILDEALEICRPMAAARGVDLMPEVQKDLPVTLVDRTRMLQVFKNLLENAVQHSPTGSRVRVVARAGQQAIECRVIDSGPGFGNADRQRLFEPYYSERRGGTGLGLAIARRVVEEHGGEIEARDAEHGGAEMHVVLPLISVRASA